MDFSPPASTGGSPITSYTVTASPGGATASGPSSPITVTGLANGGTYTFTVVATSAVGTGPASAASAAVTLPSLPGAPTIGSATATGNGQVSVAFTPPTFTSGIPIRSYTVTSTPNGITATGTSSPIAISGLPTNNYTFTVHATTVVGDGPESAASNVVKPYPPLPPQAVFARPGNTRVQLSWVAPSDTAGPTTSYTIVGSPGGLTMTVPPPAVGQDGVTSPVTVTDLTNGTTYTFTVAATNLAGTGQASLPSNTVTPQATSAPANDNIATAQAITGDSGSVSGSNVNASLEPGEPQINGNPGGSSIWYAWTPATGGGSATITTCGSSFPAILGVYRITDPTSPVSVTNIQSVFPSAGTVTCPGGLTTASSVQFDLPLTGGTFYIQVDGNNTGSGAPTGSVTLNWTK